jgi:hypothetical protein
MCIQKAQRIFLAIILGINMGLAVSEPQIAFLTQLSLMIMLLIGGFSGFCLSFEILKQFLPNCNRVENGG